jgi:peptidoglycan hydrolase-like protein with peptidoglycan-binding domain
MSKIKITQRQMIRIQKFLNESIIMEQNSDEITNIQNRLNSCFSAGLKPDGKMGPKTASAIETYTGYDVTVS